MKMLCTFKYLFFIDIYIYLKYIFFREKIVCTLLLLQNDVFLSFKFRCSLSLLNKVYHAMMRREEPIFLSTSLFFIMFHLTTTTKKQSILHDWGDEECIKILRRCKEAIPSKDNVGKLIIIDMVVKVSKEENELLETQLLFDMLMMSLVTGRERSKKDWAKLFLDRGYTDYKITPIFGFTSVIELYPLVSYISSSHVLVNLWFLINFVVLHHVSSYCWRYVRP
ncbi:putative O-methyltransferase domain, S-adenosyl-L-methionine-dependent methyltransferase [Helianthus anomalus]